MEQYSDNILLRPLLEYKGEMDWSMYPSTSGNPEPV